MKLTDLFEELADEILFSTVAKLLAKGTAVRFDYLQHGRDFSRWNRGELVSVTFEEGHNVTAMQPYAAPSMYLLVFRPEHRENVKDAVKLRTEAFARLKLYRDEKGVLTLSDRSPKDDDDPI